MAGRRDHAHVQAADLQYVAITKPAGIRPLRIDRHVRDGAGRIRESPAPRHVIGMKMGFEHMANPGVRLLRRVQVLPDLPLRIDHHCLAPRGDDVGRTAKVLVQDLSEEHAQHPLSVR